MMSNWHALKEECEKWRDVDLPLRFWWRDDDAVDVTSQLLEMVKRAGDFAVPLHLAIIPKPAKPALADFCTAAERIVPMVHGWNHQNHAPADAKKAEFGHSRPNLAQDAGDGLQRLHDLFGSEVFPCFVPPWNRITPDLIPTLPELGYVALSTFTLRQTREATPGLVQINTHVDPIDWRGGEGLVKVEDLLAKVISLLQKQRLHPVKYTEPLGILTHHLVQDPATWAFTDRLMQTLLQGGAQPLNLYEMRDDLP